jgi:hypothetical protein
MGLKGEEIAGLQTLPDAVMQLMNIGYMQSREFRGYRHRIPELVLLEFTRGIPSTRDSGRTLQSHHEREQHFMALLFSGWRNRERRGGLWQRKPCSLKSLMRRHPPRGRGPRRRCFMSVVCADSFKTRPDPPLIRSAGLRSERFERYMVCTRTIAFLLTHTVRRVSRGSWIESASGMMGETGEWLLSRRLRYPCSLSYLCIVSPRSNNQNRTSSIDNVHDRRPPLLLIHTHFSTPSRRLHAALLYR